jgi:hypothetical protein
MEKNGSKKLPLMEKLKIEPGTQGSKKPVRLNEERKLDVGGITFNVSISNHEDDFELAVHALDEKIKNLELTKEKIMKFKSETLGKFAQVLTEIKSEDDKVILSRVDCNVCTDSAWNRVYTSVCMQKSDDDVFTQELEKKIKDKFLTVITEGVEFWIDEKRKTMSVYVNH